MFTGDKDWGFRATYNILSGSDYRAGNGQDIASSYNSQNVNFALGFDLSPNSKIEFKGLRVHQQDLEFPGLYFDIHNLDTEAYNARYTLLNTPYFDRLTFDAWYNTTVADGDTRSQGAKQAFVQQLLNVSFNFPTFPQGQPFPPGLVGPLAFQDFSTTRFSNKSLGYRLATSWGEQGKALLTVGTDLNVLGQALTENILFQQTAGPPVAAAGTPPGALPLLNQVQGIPRSSGTDPGLFAEAEPAGQRPAQGQGRRAGGLRRHRQ